MHCNNSVAQLLLLLVVAAVQADVSITPSSPVAHYFYPVPRTQLQQQQQRQQQVARQFAAPALEHAAFTQALTSRGYVFGTAAPLSAPPDANSLNLKLPVPFGAMPLNVAHLPLQAGAPYASVPHTTGLTSYGTAHVQRR
ncbi:hypothetical protein ACLKA7_017539 [Drosophila subpalustris]